MRSQRARTAILVVAVACLSACGPRQSNAPERVVLVTIDTLRADRVGAYGYEHARTPTLDGLAENGTLFETALSPVPLTLPAHSTIFTGLDPPRHGVRHNAIYRLSSSIPTLTDRFAESGRETAAFVGAVVLDPRYGLARNFGTYDLESDRQAAGLGGYAERTGDAVADSALRWLAEAPPRFFLWLHFYDPHAEYEAPPGFRLSTRSPYDAEIAFTDAQLGRVLDEIHERFGPDGTLVVATSDHGEALGEHGEITHSYGIYEATQRVPLIFSGPGVAAGQRIASPVRLADVAPTLLALAGEPPLPDVDGRELSRWIAEDGPAPAGPPAYLETVATRFDYDWSPLYGLRGERWKFIQAPRPELYDLAEDPDEHENLADRQPDLVDELARELTALRERSPVAEADAVEPTSRERSQLESLGYVVGKASRSVSLEVGGRDPKDGAALLAALSRASELRTLGRSREAYELLDTVDGHGVVFRQIRFHAALTAGLHEEAESEARAAIALEPTRADSHALLAAALEVQGRVEDAHASYSHALDLEDDRTSALLGRARTAETLGDAAQARRDYETARAREPGLPEPVWRLAALEIEHGDSDAALALLGELEEDERTQPRAALRLAIAEERAGERGAALARLAAAQELAPESDGVGRYRAFLLSTSGRNEELLELAEAFLERKPDTTWAQNAAAWSLVSLAGDLDRALELAQLALQSHPHEPAILDTLSTIHLARGEAARALEHIDTALESGKEGGELRGRLFFLRARSLSQLGRAGEARSALARSFEVEPAESDEEWSDDRLALAGRLGVEPPSTVVQ